MNSMRSDEYAWSIADTFRRQDQGATDAAGNPTGPLYSLNAATRRKEETAHRKRVKDAYAFLILHIANDRVEQLLSNAPYFQDGPESLDYIMTQCMVPMTTEEVRNRISLITAVRIDSHIGYNENTVLNLRQWIDTEKTLSSTDAPATSRSQTSS